MSDESHILTEVDEHGVMLVTINRPEVMNALSLQMNTLIIDAIAEATERDDVYCVVLTGAGRGFCAGAEIGGGGGDGGEPPRRQRVDRRGYSTRIALAFSECDVPIIGAINGPAVGAGFGLALCTDVRLIADTARMGSIFIKRGLAADYGASYWLPRLVGIAKAHELFYSGDLLSAEECVEWGIANRVVLADQLLDEALAYGRMVANGPPMGYTGVRRMLQRATDMSMTHFLEYEWSTQAPLLASEDGREGFLAFSERRDPQFRGR